MPTLSFESFYSYSSGGAGILLPAILANGGNEVELLATVDTGATHCLFERRIAEILGIDLTSGPTKNFSTAIGPVKTFAHTVTLEVLNMRFEPVVYFFEDLEINRNLLGRVGWLDRLRIGLIEHDQALYLAHYDFEF